MISLKKVILISASIFCLNTILAQETPSEEESVPKLSHFEFTINPNFPIGTFGDKLDKTFYGVSMSYLHQRNTTHLSYFGVQLNYAHFGAIDEVFFEFEERTGSNLVSLQFMYRHYPDFFFWKIEPFVEALIGPQMIYTITTTTYFDDGSVDINFEDTDLGLSYGVGLGFTVHLAGQVLLLNKLNYMAGTAQTYHVPGEYVDGLPFENFETETSALNHLMWQIGVSVTF